MKRPLPAYRRLFIDLKQFALPALLGAAVFLSGCLVTSVYPFYDQKSLAFEPALLGEWSDVKDTNEHWKFEPDKTNAFLIHYSSGDSKTIMAGHTFKLKGHLFLDMFTTQIGDESQPPPIPSHHFFRVLQVGPTLRMVAMDYDWLAQLLAKNPKAVRHHLIPGEKEDQGRLVLTADTPELQKFVLKHLQTEAAWGKELELKRVTASGQ